MPEIKNAFIKGKMNKDLDERLVPNGEYRDALNIDVDYSDGSDVGALKNIKGNTVVGSIPGNGESIISSGFCIGSVKDTKENKIYWLIQDNQFIHPINGTFQDRDIIAEYDIDTDTLSPVIVDWGNSTSALKFNRSFLVTGINILDGVLYFTDNLNEPKQIDIAYWKSQTTDFLTNTTGLTEDRITVIKKSPLQAPTLALSSSTRGGNGTSGNTNVFVSLNLSDSGTNINTLSDAKESGETIVGTFTLAPNYEPGDVITLKYTFLEGDDQTKLEARILLASTYTAGATFFSGELLTISENVPGGIVQWQAILEEEDPLFELKFPLFSYRYKYNNGQYSCFAPFSKAAFLPDPTKIGDNFEYNAKDGYNLGMINSVRSITINDINHNLNTTDVAEIDILYKDSVGSNIYIVDTIKKINGNLATSFSVKDEQIYKVVEANQLLRLFDSVPKKAKSQEISSNRIIYGNYTHQFDLPNELTFDIKLKNRYNPTDDRTDLLSIKSNRTYQIGVVYMDEYGRQTPVLTDKSGIIKVPFSQGKNLTKFEPKITSAWPSFAEYYKYFIKEISKTVYNLAADSFYQDDEGYMYISFPSSEVNKIKEEDIILLKKGRDNAPSEVSTSFKVLDKLSAPPSFLAKPIEVTYDPAVFKYSAQFGDGTEQTTIKAGCTPVPNHNTITVRDFFKWQDTSAAGNVYDSDLQTAVGTSVEGRAALAPGKKVRFENADAKSKVYTVKSLETHMIGGDDIEVTFEEEFGNDILILYDDYENNPTSAKVSGRLVGVEQVDKSGSPEFEGRFFIKLKADNNLLNELVGTNVNNLNAISTTNGVDGDAQNSTSGTSGNPNNPDRQYFIRFGGKNGVNSSSTYNLAAQSGGFNQANDASLGASQLDLTEGWHITIGTTKDFDDTESYYRSHAFTTNLKAGNYISFFNKYKANGTDLDDNFYKIEDVFIGDASDGRRFWTLKFNKNLDGDVRTFFGTVDSTATKMSITVHDFKKDSLKNITNPPIFEVEPQDDVDIDIYYETQEVFVQGNHGQANNLSYHNCYSFENGVESFVIRDDYNAPALGKGVRVSTVFEDNYQEETLKSGLIYSQIYNGKTGINKLNQFIIADKITKDLNPEYGSIQKLYGRDTDLLALCEDKIIKILANKDAVFNADGNPQLIASNRVLGQAIIPATFGSYGCQNPESFVDYTYRSYFVDKVRGCVLRLSADGITEISNYGMKDYFKDNLRLQVLNSNYGYIHGTYDEVKNQYNVSLPTGVATTVSYSESIDGWSSRKSFLPEGGLSINNKYYTFKNGSLYEHHSGTINTFYGTKTDSTVTFLLNEAPANVKNFRTLNYEGDSGWVCSNIITNKQDGEVSSFVEKEGKYFNYISGITETESTIDVNALNVQGLGNLTSQAVASGNRTFTYAFNLNNDIQINDKLYYVDASNNKQNLGSITAINKINKTITIVDTSEVPQAGAYMFYVKDAKFNTSGVLGYYASVTMTNTATVNKELYSVGSEISISS